MKIQESKQANNADLARIVLLRTAISEFGKDYINYLESEIKRYEDGLTLGEEYSSLPETVESLKRSLETAKLIIAAEDRRKTLGRKK